MKNILHKTGVILLFMMVVACSKTYDDVPNDGKTIIGFTEDLYIISVPQGETSIDVEIEYLVSNTSPENRTFTVGVDADESTVSAENYTFNPSVSIPANQQITTFTFTAVDVSLTSSFEDLFLTFEDEEGIIVGKTTNLKIKTLN